MPTPYETEMELREQLRIQGEDLATLRGQVSNLIQERNEARNETRDINAAWISDVQLMNDILNEAAENADLCDQYENTLDKVVNQQCKLIELKGRQKPWRVFIEVEVEVSASTKDKADDIAEGIARYIGDGGYISDSNGDEWAVMHGYAATSRTRAI